MTHNKRLKKKDLMTSISDELAHACLKQIDEDPNLRLTKLGPQVK